MDELVSNFAPPAVGLLVAALGLLYARHVRRQAASQRELHGPEPRPAE